VMKLVSMRVMCCTTCSKGRAAASRAEGIDSINGAVIARVAGREGEE
jgi:hypothetical protein